MENCAGRELGRGAVFGLGGTGLTFLTGEADFGRRGKYSLGDTERSLGDLTIDLGVLVSPGGMLAASKQ